MVMPANGQATTQVIDRSVISDLIETIGIGDYLAIVKTLQQEVGLQISALETCAQDGGSASVKYTAHRLSGLLSQFGALRVAEYAQRMHQASTDGEVHHLAASMAKLCRASMVAIAELPIAPQTPKSD